jgi:hypothetical protein
MIHMNMQEMPSVLRMTFSITSRVSRPLMKAAAIEASAPTAELSTRLVSSPSGTAPFIRKMP